MDEEDSPQQTPPPKKVSWGDRDQDLTETITKARKRVNETDIRNNQ